MIEKNYIDGSAIDEARLLVEKERWTKLVSSTEPVDMPKVRSLVGDIYATADMPPPESVRLCASPAETVVATMQEAQKGCRCVGLPNIREAVRNSEPLLLNARERMRAVLWGPQRTRFSMNWGPPSWSGMNNRIFSGIIEAMKNSNITSIYAPYNTNEQHWAAYAQAVTPYTTGSAMLDLWPQAEMAAQCGWWYAFENVCLVTDRPKEIRFDEQGLLHCDHGPAIKYRDNWGVFSWHGVGFPSKWLDEDELTPGIALNQENIEKRRVACEILGWDRILHALEAQMVDKDPNPQIGELLSVVLPSGRTGGRGIGTSNRNIWQGREMFLRVQCGTGRTFALPVPPTMRTAQEANAWTYGLSANEYNPEIRT